MNCPNCNKQIEIQKNTVKDCACGASLICVKVNNKLVVEDVTAIKNKGEK